MTYLQHVEVAHSALDIHCVQHWRRLCSYCLSHGLPRQDTWAAVWAELAPQAKGKKAKRR